MLLLLLFSCTGETKPDDTAADTDTDTDADTDTDTDTDTDVGADDDGDGVSTPDDCDDHDYQVYPGAAELCDGVDQDCDESIDEDFDADGDGAFDEVLCDDGTDCDDTQPSVGPDAEEVPYDGLDQDCDGADLTDVDGDGYAGGGSFDCDDSDGSVHPNAKEVPKDGIDQDCDGVDLADLDGDGYDDADFGGDDCDDDDASVHPDAMDWWNDGVDTDCDEHDNTVVNLVEATVTISGTVGAQDIVGEDLAICDLDGDTLPDLVVTAPFADSYAGQIGIFYGVNAASWGAMDFIDADTLITSDDLFLGFGIGCADLDGDGADDLVTGRGEIHYRPSYVTDYELVIWYGDGATWDATMGDRTADATLTHALGVPENELTVYDREFAVADLDSDGTTEIILVDAADADLETPEDTFLVVGGGRYSGTTDLETAAFAEVRGSGLSSAALLPDLDGDGAPELFLGEGAWSGPTDTGTDTADTGTGDTAADTGDTGTEYPGRASVLPAAEVASGWLGALRSGGWTGQASEELGFQAAAGDFDGDGLQDVAVTALAESTGAQYAGAVYVFAPAEEAVPADGGSADASATLLGGTENGYFGYRLESTGDLDGDGADDLLVAEIGADSDYGRVWLISGALATGGASVEDSALMAWQGEQSGALTGNAVAVGDLDADGVNDVVIAAYGYIDSTYANGKVYLLLSGD